jgi:hypothetical protein
VKNVNENEQNDMKSISIIMETLAECDIRRHSTVMLSILELVISPRVTFKQIIFLAKLQPIIESAEHLPAKIKISFLKFLIQLSSKSVVQDASKALLKQSLKSLIESDQSIQQVYVHLKAGMGEEQQLTMKNFNSNSNCQLTHKCRQIVAKQKNDADIVRNLSNIILYLEALKINKKLSPDEFDMISKVAKVCTEIVR